MALTKVKGVVDPLALTLASEQGAEAVITKSGQHVQQELDNLSQGQIGLQDLGFTKEGDHVKQNDKWVPVVLCKGTFSTAGAGSTVFAYGCRLSARVSTGDVRIAMTEVTDLNTNTYDQIILTPTANYTIARAEGSSSDVLIKIRNKDGQPVDGSFQMTILRVLDPSSVVETQEEVAATPELRQETPCADPVEVVVRPASPTRMRGFN